MCYDKIIGPCIRVYEEKKKFETIQDIKNFANTEKPVKQKILC